MKKNYETPEVKEIDINNSNIPADKLIDSETEMITIPKKEFDETLQTIRDSNESLIKSDKMNEELNNKYLRALADYQNLQRISSDKIAFAKTDAKISIFRRLIPIIDSFEMAINSEEVSEGIKLIYNQLINYLKDYNITVIESNEGDKFDDSIHEAIAAVQTDDESKKNTIAYTQFKGYIMDKNIIRYSQVGVYV